jgi:hypothetical protein
MRRPAGVVMGEVQNARVATDPNIRSLNPVGCVDTAGSFMRPPSMPLTALKPGERYTGGERKMKGDTRCPK